MNDERELLQWQSNAMASFNYRYVNVLMKNFFIYDDYILDDLIKTDRFGEILDKIAEILSSEFKMEDNPNFRNLKHHIIIGENNKLTIIVEFRGPWILDGESNYAAIIKENKKTMYMYTSEYYTESNNFKLSKILPYGPKVYYDIVIDGVDSFMKTIEKVNL